MLTFQFLPTWLAIRTAQLSPAAKWHTPRCENGLANKPSRYASCRRHHSTNLFTVLGTGKSNKTLSEIHTWEICIPCVECW